MNQKTAELLMGSYEGLEGVPEGENARGECIQLFLEGRFLTGMRGKPIPIEYLEIAGKIIGRELVKNKLWNYVICNGEVLSRRGMELVPPIPEERLVYLVGGIDSVLEK